jgi:hypothetical protein
MTARAWWRRHSLSTVLFAGFFLLTTYSAVTGWWEYQQDVLQPGAPLTFGGYLVWFSWEYATSILADVFGAWVLVILTKKLREAGSPESGDDDQ